MEFVLRQRICDSIAALQWMAHRENLVEVRVEMFSENISTLSSELTI